MRWSILFLIAILLFPIAFAEVSIVSPEYSQYNFGDTLSVVAHVEPGDNFEGYFNVIADCDQSLTLDTKLIDVSGGGKYTYDEEFLLTEDFVGSCVLSAELTDKNFVRKSIVSSGTFGVSGGLLGEFTTNEGDYQLGERFELRGAISNLNSRAIDGVASILLKKDGAIKFIDTKNIEDGIFTYERELSLIPGGNYVVEVRATDSYGNSNTFEGATSFNLYGGLTMETSMKEEYNPGDEIDIEGLVKGNSGRGVKDISVEFVFEDYNKKETLEDSGDQFEFSYELSEEIKGGSHSVVLNAVDKKGNVGSEEFVFTVPSIPTSLDVEILSFNHLPEKDLEFRVEILDQGGEIISDLVQVELRNPDGDVIANDYFESGQIGSYIIPKFAEPDNWELKFLAFEIEEELEFEVDKFVNLETTLEGQELKVRNLGNAEYDDEFHIIADAVDLFKDISVGANRTTTIDLGGLLDDGIYDVLVPATSDVFESVSVKSQGFLKKVGEFFTGAGVTASAVGTSTGGQITLWVFVLIILVVVGLIIFFKIRKKKKKPRNKEYVSGQKKREQLKKKTVRHMGHKYGHEDYEHLRKSAVAAYDEQKDKPAVMGTKEIIHANGNDHPEASPKPHEGGNIFDIFK